MSSRTETPNSHVADPAVFPAPAASRSQQSETDAAQGRQTVGPQLPPIDTGALVAQGDHLLGRSDIASARIFYQRAAEAGDGRGALLRRSLGIVAPVRLGTLKRSSCKEKPQLSRRALRLPASEPVIDDAELRHHTTLNAAEPAASRKRLR